MFIQHVAPGATGAGLHLHVDPGDLVALSVATGLQS